MAKHGNKAILATIFLIASLYATPQKVVKSALFLGNSYTYVNNLPMQVSLLADSAGDMLYHDMYAPGGYTLGWQPIAHCFDPATLALISQGSWDYVVLQEQSQIPAIPVLRDSCMFPASQILHDSVNVSNPGGKVLFFLTWGRRFGGMQCFEPNYCSTDFAYYGQMQDSITVSYLAVAGSLNDAIAPAGEAWRFVIDHYGMVLHDQDNSHPNIKGSYLAACVFYCSMFGKHVTGNTFTAGLLPDTALILQQAADSIVFGYWDLWNLGGPSTVMQDAGCRPPPVVYYDRSSGMTCIKGIYSDGVMEVYDISGRKIRTLVLVGGKGDPGDLARGIYICRGTVGGASFSQKILIQ